jgi:mRNA-degrading endonuclease RelE of RelBE toxin-antitoxin system
MAQVELTPEAADDFRRLPTAIKARVRDVIVRLPEWPDVSGAKPLRHTLKGAFRIRTGDYRVVFIAKANIVRVIRIDNRRDVYSR